MPPRTPTGHVTVRSQLEKIYADLEKVGADPNFVRYMISREDLDGKYYDRVSGGEDGDSDMDMSDEICKPTHTPSFFFLSRSFFISDALAESCFPLFSLF